MLCIKLPLSTSLENTQKKNPQLAFNLYKKAAFLGDKDAQAVVDEYRLAAKNGNREAIILINNSD